MAYRASRPGAARSTRFGFTLVLLAVLSSVIAAVSVGNVALALVALLVMLVSGRIRDDDRLLLVVRGPRSQELAVEGVVFEFFEGRAIQRDKTTTPDTVEMSFELTRKALDRAQARADASVTERLLSAGGVDQVNLVSLGARTSI